MRRRSCPHRSPCRCGPGRPRRRPAPSPWRSAASLTSAGAGSTTFLDHAAPPAALRTTPDPRRAPAARYVARTRCVLGPIGDPLQVLEPASDGTHAASIVAAAILTVPSFCADELLAVRRTPRRTSSAPGRRARPWRPSRRLAGHRPTCLVQQWPRQLAPCSGSSVLVAQMTGFGLDWVGRYLVLDRWLFEVDAHVRSRASDLDASTTDGELRPEATGARPARSSVRRQRRAPWSSRRAHQHHPLDARRRVPSHGRDGDRPPTSIGG